MTSIKQELGPRQRRWLEALRSGKYRQGREVLHNLDTDTWCCLGVACDLFAEECGVVRGVSEATCGTPVESFGGVFSILPDPICQHLGFFDGGGREKDLFAFTLAALNDDGMAFTYIADLVEADPATYFKEPL